MSEQKILIIGAGPCGLGAAHRLTELGYRNWLLFEAGKHVGGLSASFVDVCGFTWDIGGHVLFSHYDYFDRVVENALGNEYFEHQRESWVRILQRWVPYPFQNNVRHLPDEALAECVEGLGRLTGAPGGAANFREWMDTVFGSGIVKYFMEPYNKKVWGVPLETMGKEWIAERVSVVDLDRVRRNIAEGRDDVSWGPNSTFRFPRRGGTGAIWEGIAQPLRDHIRLEHELVAVDLESKRVTFANGSSEGFDILINTSPLDLLVGKCSPVSERVRDAAGGLVHNGGLIVGVGLEEVRTDSRCWMYFPECNSPFYRVTNFHNYSPFNVPDGEASRYSSLMCETTYSSHKPEEKGTIVERTLAGLAAAGMFEQGYKERVASTYLIDIPYSYPVPTLTRDRALAMITPYLEERGVFSRGRFGAWKYEVGNMDHSFMQGVEAVERIVRGTAERTVNGH